MSEPLLGDLIVLAFALERVAEVAFNVANVRRLVARGGILVRNAATGPMLAIHALWFTALVLERHVVGARMFGGVALGSLVALAAVSAALRIWVFATLGRRWSIQVVVVPGERPIRRGPYRFVRHPNYVVVVAEVAVVALLVGAWRTALVLSLLHLPVLAARVRGEEEAWRRIDPEGLAPVPRFVPFGRAASTARRAS